MQQQQQQQQFVNQNNNRYSQQQPFSQPSSLQTASTIHPHHQQQTPPQIFTNENLPPLQQHQQSNNPNNLTNTELLHQSFLMMNGTLPPQHQQPQITTNLKQYNNPNMRRQSVPAVTHHARKQPNQPAPYQPLTPQLNRISSSNGGGSGESINVKRNLNFMFDQLPPENTNISRNTLQINGCSNDNQDRLVPTSILQRVQNGSNGGIDSLNQQLLANHQDNRDNLFDDLAFPLNDISSPDDLEDIHLDKMDGNEGDDDLLKSLSSNNNYNGGGNINDGGVLSSSWVNDWSNATLPVMNVS